MQVQPGLTKEGFWNSMMEKYPLATDHFCKWIDRYKKAVDWDCLFGDYIDNGDLKPYKFHDIPYAMQLGIFLTYMRSFERSRDTINELTMEPDFIEDLEGMVDCFFILNEEIFKNIENG